MSRLCPWSGLCSGSKQLDRIGLPVLKPSLLLETPLLLLFVLRVAETCQRWSMYLLRKRFDFPGSISQLPDDHNQVQQSKKVGRGGDGAQGHLPRWPPLNESGFIGTLGPDTVTWYKIPVPPQPRLTRVQCCPHDAARLCPHHLLSHRLP